MAYSWKANRRRKEEREGGVGEPGKVRALRMFCPTASPRSVARR